MQQAFIKKCRGQAAPNFVLISEQHRSVEGEDLFAANREEWATEVGKNMPKGFAWIFECPVCKCNVNLLADLEGVTFVETFVVVNANTVTCTNCCDRKCAESFMKHVNAQKS